MADAGRRKMPETMDRSSHPSATRSAALPRRHGHGGPRYAAVLALLLVAAPARATPADDITPRELPIPAVTAWRPAGCRGVPFSDPVLPPRTAFRRAHGDLESSDEVDLAYPPVFERQWIAEPSLYQVTTPSFDSAGNLYMTPLLPHEPILMLSLDGATGARRFVVPLGPGQRGGGAVPLVLRDPDHGGEVVYAISYERLIASRTDGTAVWNVPTGLGPASAADQSPIGLAYTPNADAIVGLTRDGFIFLLDRRTGAPLLAPVPLPGQPTPPAPTSASPALAAAVNTLLQPLVAFPDGFGVAELIQVLLGGNSKVANNLSVDGRRGRLWIAASARDEEDGTADGVSELGAVYRYDVVRDGDGWRLDEICHRNFSGGSASTPTLGQNGTRVYLGDDAGALIAIDAETCAEAWSVPLDAQIFGSIATASDGRELYAASANGIFQVFDDGAAGRRGWEAALDLYDVPAELSNYVGMNLLLTGIGANGLLIQTGVGIAAASTRLPVRTGIAHVDRRTGAARWFADGLEESLGAMSTGAGGALYLPHAPLRRAFSIALGLTDQPVIGGVSKWGSTRDDLLARDAACAAAARAANAATLRTVCPQSAAADAGQVDVLRRQMVDAAARAEAGGRVAAQVAGRLRWLATRVGPPPLPAGAAARYERRIERYHRKAARGLGRACRILSDTGG